jgi:hypothetical protein
MPDFSASKQRTARRLDYQRQQRASLIVIVFICFFCLVGLACSWLVAAAVGGIGGIALWFSLSITICLVVVKLSHSFAKWMGLLSPTVECISWRSLSLGWGKSHLFVVAPLVTAIWITTLYPYGGIIIALFGWGFFLFWRKMHQGKQP